MARQCAKSILRWVVWTVRHIFSPKCRVQRSWEGCSDGQPDKLYLSFSPSNDQSTIDSESDEIDSDGMGVEKVVLE